MEANYKLPTTNYPLLVIIGETASGKSALALKLAKKFNGEIICADSWTVYKGFNIGTAKPTAQEQAEVRHHLLDIADPKQGFSAAEFKRQATKTIDYINARGKLPILAGGTGLYVDSILFDYGFLPPGSAGQRAELNNLSLTELQNTVKEQKIDTTGIDVNNKRRLIRLIETGGQRPARSDLRANTLAIGILTAKDGLEGRIEARVDKMLAKGLEQEVKGLAKRYGWQTEPMKGIGYREFRQYFEGQQTLDQTRQQIIRSTMQLAKKQRTWFKRNKSIHWVQNLEQAQALVQNFLSKT